MMERAAGQAAVLAHQMADSSVVVALDTPIPRW
jgi:hypothetical protein